MSAAPQACKIQERLKTRDRVGVWGFGNVSRDVVMSLVDEELGQEIVFYGRPKGPYANRARAYVEDLKANVVRRPRIMGTNEIEDMAGLDVIFVGVGVPRKEGQTRADLLALNTQVIAETTLEIRSLYEGCGQSDLPVLVFMGNPVTAMTWVAWKASGFPKANIMGQAGNLDSRRICHAVSQAFGLSGKDMKGVVFGDHGDTMVASPKYFSVGGIPLDVFARQEGMNAARLAEVMAEAKQGGTHFVKESGQSASAGPAKAAVDMLRPIIRGESEIQPVVAIAETEYGLIPRGDALTSMGFGLPARIGPGGVEKIVEVDVSDIRGEIDRSAASVRENIAEAARILKERFNIQ